MVMAQIAAEIADSLASTLLSFFKQLNG